MTEIKEFIKDGALKAVEKDGKKALVKIVRSLYGAYVTIIGHSGFEYTCDGVWKRSTNTELEKAVIEKVGEAKYVQALDRVGRSNVETSDEAIRIIKDTPNEWTRFEGSAMWVVSLITATPTQRLAAMLLALASLEGSE